MRSNWHLVERVVYMSDKYKEAPKTQTSGYKGELRLLRKQGRAEMKRAWRSK